MKNRPLSFFFAALLLSLIYSCSSPGQKKEPGKEVAPEPVHETHMVEISQMKFIPAEITIKKGDQVVFINHDLVNHDVTEDSNAWSSSTLEPGKYWTLTPATSQHYYCTIHVVMKGSIRVE